MTDPYNLQRFVHAQENSFALALSEIRKGKKQSHWMWYIFPQVSGLGFSAISATYAISDLKEADSYLQHPVLGPRLIEISKELLRLPAADAHSIFGTPDDLKLRSSMTLFSAVRNADPVFRQVLDKFFNGQEDVKTKNILSAQGRSDNRGS